MPVFCHVEHFQYHLRFDALFADAAARLATRARKGKNVVGFDDE